MGHTIQELQMRQALPLNLKISMTKTRIREWINRYGTDGVYVSFSGGKDSTVLLDIVRQDYPEVKAMFVDVPTQYPELKEFAMSFDNVDIVKPKISFMQVCEKYGFPLISKETSGCVQDARRYLKTLISQEKPGGVIPNAYAMADLLGIERRADKENATYQALKMGNIPSDAPVRFLQLIGRKMPHKEKGKETGEYSKMFDRSKYLFFLEADFEISDKCCSVMKKAPAHKYNKETGRHPMTAQMASESMQRTQKWLKNGCNAFDLKEPVSNPMSFWTDQDVLLYIKERNLPICSVYGEVVEDWDNSEDVEGQMTISDLEGYGDMGLFDAKRPPLKTTGCQRTGCMLCGFGCHLEKSPNRFEMLKETHPGMYKLLDVVKNNGVTMREAIEWVNEHGNMDIKL